MSDQPSDLDIKSLGWRQGRFVPRALAIRIVEDGSIPGPGDDDQLLVVSHDCDVTQLSLEKEPFVELLRCRRLQTNPDGNLTLGKNPRVLHFPALETGAEKWFEARAHERYLVRRGFLATESPHDSLAISDKTKRLIRNWCADRYSREYFPDEFNKRMAEVSDQVKEKLVRNGRYVSGIYLQGAEEELAPEDSYVLDVVGAMKPDDYDDPKKLEQANLALAQFEAIVSKVPGIRVDSSRVLSEKSISVADVEFLRRWDTDAMSLKLDTEGPLRPGR